MPWIITVSLLDTNENTLVMQNFSSDKDTIPFNTLKRAVRDMRVQNPSLNWISIQTIIRKVQ